MTPEHGKLVGQKAHWAKQRAATPKDETANNDTGDNLQDELHRIRRRRAGAERSGVGTCVAAGALFRPFVYFCTIFAVIVDEVLMLVHEPPQIRIDQHRALRRKQQIHSEVTIMRELFDPCRHVFAG